MILREPYNLPYATNLKIQIKWTNAWNHNLKVTREELENILPEIEAQITHLLLKKILGPGELYIDQINGHIFTTTKGLRSLK